MNTEQLVDQHYGFGGILEKIETGLKLAGKDFNALSVDDLAPIDEFHTRGRESTLELAQLANISTTTRILDVGCGLGGTARHLAEQYKCSVAGVDLTEEYVSVGNELTRRVGLADRVKLQQGSALEIPFEDESFDIAWTEHVQMNIEDKKKFYAEIARVLKPGGILLFHDIFRGSGDAPMYPAPWAEDESISSLATEEKARACIEAAGLEMDTWLVKDEESAAFFNKVLAKVKSGGPPPIGIHLLMGDNARVKLQNYLCNLTEHRVTVVLGMFHKK